MAGQINGNHSIVFGEYWNLVVPDVPVTAPAVDEDQCRLALALNRIVNRNTVCRRYHGSFLAKGSQGNSKQNESQKHFAPHFTGLIRSRPVLSQQQQSSFQING